VPAGGPWLWYVCPTPTIVVDRLGSAEAGAYAQVVFDAAQTYDDALYTVSDLGIYLADPCYEQAVFDRKSPAWHPMGQETSFTATHTPAVRTGIAVTAVTWRQQLSASAGVTQVTTPYAPQCP
jgi:hypothetical protein